MGFHSNNELKWIETNELYIAHKLHQVGLQTCESIIWPKQCCNTCNKYIAPVHVVVSTNF